MPRLGKSFQTKGLKGPPDQMLRLAELRTSRQRLLLDHFKVVGLDWKSRRAEGAKGDPGLCHEDPWYRPLVLRMPMSCMPTAPASSDCFLGVSHFYTATFVIPGQVDSTLNPWEALDCWDPEDKYRGMGSDTHTPGLDPSLSGSGPQLPAG